MLKLVALCALLSASTMLLAGCVMDSSVVDASDFVQAPGKTVEPPQVDTLEPGDTIEISVEVDGNMEVSMYQASISALGSITLPLVGDVRVGSLPLSTARSVIAAKYGAYYVHSPVIMISLVASPESGEWGAVTVTGRVAQPGRIPIKSVKGMKLTEVIQNAGGFAASAKKNDIRITRVDRNGKKSQISVNYEEIGREGNIDADITLIDGDIVYIPERIL